MNHHPAPLSFDWDEGNRDKNQRKHNVHWKEAEQLFFDQPIFFRDEMHSQTENRYVGYGLTELGRQITVNFTIRKKKIRVISARDQSKRKEEYIN